MRQRARRAPDEEFELCKKLARNGRIARASATVLTSARKFREEGRARTYWRMARCTLRCWLGASPEKLVEIYSPLKAK